MKLLQSVSLGSIACLAIVGCQSSVQSSVGSKEIGAPRAPVRESLNIPRTGPPESNNGFVMSPYAPTLGYVDVRAFNQNTVVRCPYTGKRFRVPPGISSSEFRS